MTEPLESDEWEDGDLEEMPIEGVATPEPARLRRRGWRRPPHGNTPALEAEGAKQAALEEATGRRQPEPEPWRGALAQGDRTGAAASFEDGRVYTHNAGSGFGAAGRPWWERRR